MKIFTPTSPGGILYWISLKATVENSHGKHGMILKIVMKEKIYKDIKVYAPEWVFKEKIT